MNAVQIDRSEGAPLPRQRRTKGRETPTDAGQSGNAAFDRRLPAGSIAGEKL